MPSRRKIDRIVEMSLSVQAELVTATVPTNPASATDLPSRRPGAGTAAAVICSVVATIPPTGQPERTSLRGPPATVPDRTPSSTSRCSAAETARTSAPTASGVTEMASIPARTRCSAKAGSSEGA